MSALSDRRGFLRGLVSLPLIGGGVTLIGSPSAVAEPASLHLLSEYESWLGIEHSRVARELRPGTDHAGWRLYGPAHDWHLRACRDVPPSTRAALVLAAVGCDWREGGR